MEFYTSYRHDLLYPGAVFESSNYGKYKILGKSADDSRKNRFIVQFIDTGTTSNVDAASIRRGSVKDIYAKKILNVACVGNTTATICGKTKREYNLWYHMIDRCYGENKKYATYKDYSVSEEWLCFEYFEQQISLIKNYDKWIADPSYQLDKDIYSRENGGNKIYSVETCCFISILDNVKEMTERVYQKKFKAISPDGTVYISNNQTEFGKTHGIQQKTISSLLKNQDMKNRKGWEFLYIEE